MLRTVTMLFLCLSIISLSAQCDYPNADLEDWYDVTADLDESGTIAPMTVLLPESHVSSFRFLFMLFDIAFTTPGTPEYENIFKNGFGLFPDSDAFTGSTAMRIGGDDYTAFADVLTLVDCNLIPQSITFSYKHVGESPDTLSILSLVNKGFGDLPQTSVDFDTFPGYINLATFSTTTEDSYTTVTLDYVNNNLSVAVDTLVNIFLVTGNEKNFANGVVSYFLIDDIKINYEPSGLEEVNTFEASVFPNPAIDFLNVTSEVPVSLEIYDIIGQLQLKITEASYDHAIDISTLNSGSHLIKMIGRDQNVKYEKLIVR